MNPSSLQLTGEFQEKCEKLFEKEFLLKALELLRESRLAVSFTKGTIDTYFIVSGIIRDNYSHESKVTYKKRLEGTEEGPLKSLCQCNLWTPEGHCPHTASLFLYFILENTTGLLDVKVKDYDSDSPPISLNTSMGVNVQEYGTIVPSPHRLEGAAPRATYSSLQYLLHTNKIVNFPIPETLEGKVILNLISKIDGSEKEESIKHHGEELLLNFYHLSEEGHLNKHISIFENLYLFDWNTGKAYSFVQTLKSFFQKIRIHHKYISVNEALLLIDNEDVNKYVDVYIDGKPLDDLVRKHSNLNIVFANTLQKSKLKVTLQFQGENEQVISAPPFLRAFTFNGGLLDHFSKKKDAYDFIGSLSQAFINETDHYKKTLVQNSKRKNWLDIISHAFTKELTLQYDENSNSIYEYENKNLLLLVSELYQKFDENFFRFSEYDPTTKELNFVVSGTRIYEGLADFYDKLHPYGINFFFNNKEITRWNSRVRFERHSVASDWFDLSLNINQQDLEVLQKVDLDQRLAETEDGLVLLDKDQKNLSKFLKRYLDEGKGNKEKIEDEETKASMFKFSLPFNRARIFELFELRKIGLDGALTEEEIQLCEKLATLESMPEYTLPENLQDTLRPYQKTGFRWLRFLHEYKLGACLADDMGLGKTLQAISFIDSIYDEVEHVLIVCPVTLLLNWENEFKKFSNVDEIQIYHGGTREIDLKKKIILTSYGVMKKEAETTFADTTFDVLVLDEVQHLKNIRSLGAFAARKIKAKFRLCLTGTPVENDLAEFYNILDLSIPGIWGDLRFVRSNAGQTGRMIARKTASPFILRRTKGQVLSELPPKIENNVLLSLSDDEQNNYKETLNGIKNKIMNSPSNKKYGEILKGLLKLRQSCLWQSSNTAATKYLSTKISFLLETLDQILEEGHQAIIFSQFTTYLDIMTSHLQSPNIKLARIDGSQSIKKRQSQVDRFQSGEANVFLISLKAGGVGLNLTAASYVFIMDPWWNPAVESQAIDRAHRIGQKNTLTVYRPIIKDSVEEKVLKLQEIKRELFNDLLADDDDNYFSGKLTMKDFEQLLS